MRAVDINHKQTGRGELSQQEIEAFIQGYVRGDIPDLPSRGVCMAVYCRGMTPEETTHLTAAMAYSGDTLDLT